MKKECGDYTMIKSYLQHINQAQLSSVFYTSLDFGLKLEDIIHYAQAEASDFCGSALSWKYSH